ncbi:hypothetical protein [Microvirga antarctica]|uniref:hypothetical protein n=1 Tax=Microvirga antarctica TaxID=2819233 RepID=UPI001FE57ADD|nr:hypothetical protein [Microvirga antarctica]
MLAAIAEVATGLALIFVPSVIALLLIGSGVEGVAAALARVAGIALIGLGIACWPGPPTVGMLTYSTAVAVYLGYLGYSESFTGPLLWPVVVLHLVLSAFLAGSIIRTPQNAG